FQAEDGIRDLIVTGVQTCALPIYGRGPGPCGAARHREPGASRPDRSCLRCRTSTTPHAHRENRWVLLSQLTWLISWFRQISPARSEERRVGKECRSRGSASVYTT